MSARYCHRCGGLLACKENAGSSVCRLVCDSCDTVHYEGPTLLVWCYVSCGLELLMCRRAEEPAYGLWNPPGGFVEASESLEDAATRELLEEAGIRVAGSRLQLFGIVSLPHMNQVHVGFHVALEEMPRLLPGPEVLEARFFAQSDLPLEELAYQKSIGAGYPSDIYAYLRGERSGISSVTVHGAAG